MTLPNILIAVFTFILIIVSAFVILIVLMQKAKTDGGMGATLGGSTAEGVFGHETGNVLTNWTIKAAIAFFILSLGLYLGHLYVNKGGKAGGKSLPNIAPAAPAAAPTPLPTPPSVEAPKTDAAPAAPAAAPTAPAPTTATPAAAEQPAKN